MSLLVNQGSIAMPYIQRAAFFVLFKTLNQAISDVDAAWQASDLDFALETDREPVLTLLEPVDPANFYEGHKPSLMKAPPDRYPNVSVIAYRSIPGAGSDSFDHQTNYSIQMAVETMVKATEEEGEEVCNRRVQRMNEAVAACLDANKTLGGTVSGFASELITSITDLNTRQDRGSSSANDSRTAYGPSWFWQGSRIEFSVRKESSHTFTGGSSFAEPSSYQSLDIDQA